MPCSSTTSPASMRWCQTSREMAGKRSLKKSSVVGQAPAGSPMQLGPTPLRAGGTKWVADRLLDPLKHHVPHAVAEFDAAVFKLGQRSVMRLGRVAGQFRVG